MFLASKFARSLSTDDAAYLSVDYPQAIQQRDKIKGSTTAQHQPNKDLVDGVMLGVAFAQVAPSLAKQVSGANPTDAFVWYPCAMFHAMNGSHSCRFGACNGH
ncbi:MAG: hypothetical protein ACJAWG_003534 [Candidatus Azotimanducaceae bacterium]